MNYDRKNVTMLKDLCFLEHSYYLYKGLLNKRTELDKIENLINKKFIELRNAMDAQSLYYFLTVKIVYEVHYQNMEDTLFTVLDFLK